MPDLQKLYATIQQNCHIVDSRYAQDYGLCTYLLKMRELYRWEKQLPLLAKLSRADVGEWLTAREQLWKVLINDSFSCLPIQNECYDPFETASINRALLPQGLVYSGGYGTSCKPSFFIGRLHHREWREGLEILIAAEEYARDLTASPAMIQGTTVWIRRESVRRTIWEKMESWDWHKSDNQFARLLELYPVTQNLEIALERMTEDEMENMINHEIGEFQAGRLLGEKWEQMLIAIAGTKAEMIARAVRDHLADCLVTLPRLLETGQAAAGLFYSVNLHGMHRAIFPTLVKALQDWLMEEEKLVVLRDTVNQGQKHWLTIGQSLLKLYAELPEESIKLISQQMAVIIF